MKGRKVPFKNFTLEGAAIDVSVYCYYQKLNNVNNIRFKYIRKKIKNENMLKFAIYYYSLQQNTQINTTTETDIDTFTYIDNQYLILDIIYYQFQWDNSNESQVSLSQVDFKLSGQFHCEVSITAPLYTKASTEQLMTIYCTYRYQ